ncbi:MAG: hypothetical protein GXY85_08760 [Candidatus Brocadiaceae bacterium]|nr:hypothetical protein [Candidatus Brocadiaceae bacterium]
MNRKERVQAVLAGRRPDRAPVSFWHHFPADAAAGQPAVDAHMRHLEAYDLDFLKIMGDNGYPRPKPIVTSIGDLGSFQVLNGDEGPFEMQLGLIRGLRTRLGPDVLCCTTLFNAWTVLRRCLGDADMPPVPGGGGADPRDDAIKGWLEQDRPAFVEALDRVARSLANFAARCVEAGADGVFLSCREDWVEGPGGPGTYEELVRPRDLLILDAVKDATFNVLHVCGTPIDFRRFNDYPVHVVNWPDRQCGPSIASVKDWLRPAICGGVNNLTTMPKGTPRQCADEVRDALRQAGERPIIIGAGCTYDPAAVPAENLRAIRRAVGDQAFPHGATYSPRG